jgi:hypothetical protein
VRFELNDPFITAIAYLLDNREKTKINEFVEEEPNQEDIKKVEDQYLKLKQEEEEKIADEKYQRDVFGETGPVVYDEDVFKITEKKRKITVKK